jgi:hypothetical protein
MATDTSRKGTQVNGFLWLVGKVIAKHAPFHENENNYNQATTSTIHIMVCLENKQTLWTCRLFLLAHGIEMIKKKNVFTAMLIHFHCKLRTRILPNLPFKYKMLFGRIHATLLEQWYVFPYSRNGLFVWNLKFHNRHYKTYHWILSQTSLIYFTLLLPVSPSPGYCLDVVWRSAGPDHLESYASGSLISW